MKNAAVLLAIFVRDLLVQPEGSVIVLGRVNMRRDDYKTLQIVIDDVVALGRISSSETYDPTTENMQYNQQLTSSATVDFYGDGAYDESVKFVTTIASQRGSELQRDSFIDVLQQSAITDLKMLAGDEYSERFQVAVNIVYNIAYNESILRIDTTDFSVITD